MSRATPYRGFHFRLAFCGPAAGADLGGFSEVSGLGPPLVISADREGGSPRKPVRSILAVPKAAHITLKRGVVDAHQFRAWTTAAASTGAPRRDIAIVMADEKGTPVNRWILHQAMPIKQVSAPLSAKGTDVAMEELVLGSESISVE